MNLTGAGTTASTKPWSAPHMPMYLEARRLVDATASAGSASMPTQRFARKVSEPSCWTTALIGMVSLSIIPGFQLIFFLVEIRCISDKQIIANQIFNRVSKAETAEPHCKSRCRRCRQRGGDDMAASERKARRARGCL